MYQQCKLIHADLSEYNMLWHEEKLWFIDVSQSVEPFHPHALEFLYRDCTNVVEFFSKCGVPDVVPAHELFNKVSELGVNCDKEDFLSQVGKLLQPVTSFFVLTIGLCWTTGRPNSWFMLTCTCSNEYESQSKKRFPYNKTITKNTFVSCFCPYAIDFSDSIISSSWHDSWTEKERNAVWLWVFLQQRAGESLNPVGKPLVPRRFIKMQKKIWFENQLCYLLLLKKIIIQV